MKETRTNHRANMFIKFTRIVKLHTQIPHKKKKKGFRYPKSILLLPGENLGKHIKWEKRWW